MIRKFFFWLHLLAGAVAGLIIAVMCFTGVLLAFEKQLVAFADRANLWITPPAPGTPRLPLDELVARATRAQFPDLPAQPAVTLAADPAKVVIVQVGRGQSVYVHPYTGNVAPQGAQGMRDFLHEMEDWHRWLATGNENRAWGKGITGACNAAFLFLALSGLYLWWPRRWTRQALRPSLWFIGASGKARDWNWHNAIGFWSAPVLIVLTLSGVVISYRWASDAGHSLTGNTPPAGPAPVTQVEVPKPEAGAKRLGYDALFAAARAQAPNFETISLRFGGGDPRRGPAVAAGNAERKPQPVTASIKIPGSWPLFYTPSWQLDPFTGAVLKREGFADLNGGRQARTWLRFLHTGEALGWPGQLVAGLACLGGLFLVWTGFALAWRRFRSWRATAAEVAAVRAGV